LIKFNKELIIQWLKDLFKKEVIKKILGSAAGGLRLFLLVTALNYLWKKFLGPAIRYSFRKVTKFFNGLKYKKKAKRLENAETENDFNSATDNLP
jgi:uncharacterized membrane protein required for colicin V production